MNNKLKNSIKYACATDVGCVRELNEDSLFCNDILWLVADGMGGHACGEVASQLAAQTIAEEFSLSGQLSNAIEIAHQKVMAAGKSDKGQFGMGTTVVALTSNDETYQIAWVGDSRAYLWEAEKGRLSQLSEDHSLIVRLLKSGLISKEDAINHPQRHMITQCLGSVEIDKVDVDVVDGKWKAKQQVLLCSDGLTDELNESQIGEILKQPLSLNDKLAALIEAAKLKGGKDNVSVILIDSPVTNGVSLWTKLKSLFG